MTWQKGQDQRWGQVTSDLGPLLIKECLSQNPSTGFKGFWYFLGLFTNVGVCLGTDFGEMIQNVHCIFKGIYGPKWWRATALCHEQGRRSKQNTASAAKLLYEKSFSLPSLLNSPLQDTALALTQILTLIWADKKQQTPRGWLKGLKYGENWGGKITGLGT